MPGLLDKRAAEYQQTIDLLNSHGPPPDHARTEALEKALISVWHDLTTETAATYLKTLQCMVERLRDGPVPMMPPQTPLFDEVGPYVTVSYLGMGGGGQGVSAYHRDTQQPVCLKLFSDAEGFVLDWLQGSLSPQFLRLYEWGAFKSSPGVTSLWCARQLADETWADYRARLDERPPLDEALAVFAEACRGVAALHEQQVFHWSAHERNRYRVGATWKLGDLGRRVMAATADDPRFVRLYRAEELSPVERSALLEALSAGPWREWPNYDAFLRDHERETRLRLDDCAMLAGLLIDLLGQERWPQFHRAIHTRPLCDARYMLTSRGRVDRQLSRLVNRAWLGDTGGAMAVATGKPWDAGYDDALELLRDSDSTLKNHHSRPHSRHHKPRTPQKQRRWGGGTEGFTAIPQERLKLGGRVRKVAIEPLSPVI